MSTSRRDFLQVAGALAAAGFVPRALPALGVPPASRPPGPAAGLSVAGLPVAGGVPSGPCVVASANGLRGVQVAYDRLVAGEDPLDAIIAGVNLQELDPDDQSVGLGGLPNADGVVTLDASCMHGPTRRAGAVACLEDIATPSLVAKAVMDYTDHVLLAGPEARRFALELGFRPQPLLTERSRQDWLRWRARLNANDMYLDYDGDVAIKFHTGTINMNAVTAGGDVASVTTTSGMAWKVPGRVGDSPIIGAGQYCDNTVGAAGSTGRGEANIKACGAFLAVEFMRQGVAPEEALLRVMQRVIAMTEDRLLGPNGRPRFDLQFYALTRDGRFAGATAYEGASFAVCDAAGPRLVECAYLFRSSERPR